MTLSVNGLTRRRRGLRILGFVAMVAAVGAVLTGTFRGTMQSRAHAQASITLAAGWNLVGGPAGAVFPGGFPMYTLGPGDSSYETLASQTPIDAGKGYWVYEDTPTSVTFSTAGDQFLRLDAPAGAYFMIGNPNGSAEVSVSGLDVLYTYDAGSGQYVATTQLAPGQGGWAFSQNGGPVTISTVGSSSSGSAYQFAGNTH